MFADGNIGSHVTEVLGKPQIWVDLNDLCWHMYDTTESFRDQIVENYGQIHDESRVMIKTLMLVVRELSELGAFLEGQHKLSKISSISEMWED